jgi:hypothetical protein
MDQLNTDLATLASTLTAVQADVAALPAPGATDPNDTVVASMVTALTDAGYTVTAPAPADAPELPEGPVSVPVTEG